jgi:uncharacterized protein (PEP-CTERM system associated)
MGIGDVSRPLELKVSLRRAKRWTNLVPAVARLFPQSEKPTPVRCRHRFLAVPLFAFALACSSICALTASANAQGTPPLGVPIPSPLTNPFPVPQPQEVTPPNFEYQSQLQPTSGLVPEPGFQLVPRISLGEEFNDNIYQSEYDRRWDLITLIAPGIAISNNTPKLSLSLNYSPTVQIYSRTSSLDAVEQQLSALADATIVPDEFYVNARAFATQVPTNGGFTGFNFGVPTVTSPGFGTTALGLNKNNLSQVFTASVTPYLVHRFADFGTGKAGLNLTESYASQTTGTLIGSPPGPAEHTTTGEAIAQFISGDSWGRVVDIATLDAARSLGRGASANSTTALADNQIGYVLRPWLLPFGEFGVESIHYTNVTPNVSVDDGIWGVGVTLLPNQDSHITLEYGHRDGITSFQANANYAVTARTVLSATYTAGLTTDLQNIAGQLEITGLNPLGNAINVNTSAPVSLVNSLSGINNTVYRNHQLTLTATTLMDRNTIALSIQHQNEQPIASTVAQPLVNDTNTSGTITWIRDINIRTTLASSLSYGVRNVEQQNEKFFGATASLRYTFTDNLTGSAIYSYYDRGSNVPGESIYENIVLLSITRTF